MNGNHLSRLFLLCVSPTKETESRTTCNEKLYPLNFWTKEMTYFYCDTKSMNPRKLPALWLLFAFATVFSPWLPVFGSCISDGSHLHVLLRWVSWGKPHSWLNLTLTSCNLFSLWKNTFQWENLGLWSQVLSWNRVCYHSVKGEFI